LFDVSNRGMKKTSTRVVVWRRLWQAVFVIIIVANLKISTRASTLFCENKMEVMKITENAQSYVRPLPLHNYGDSTENIRAHLKQPSTNHFNSQPCKIHQHLLASTSCSSAASPSPTDVNACSQSSHFLNLNWRLQCIYFLWYWIYMMMIAFLSCIFNKKSCIISDL
jgi:hypothetical protein